jgi:molecular chaperone Hsp31 and glyoxalase 3
VGDDLDDSVYKDRELITGASNFGAQKFAELAIKSLLAIHKPTGDVVFEEPDPDSPASWRKRASEAGCDMDALNWRNTWEFMRHPRACLAPVPAEKRTRDEPDSFIPSVFSSLASSPSTQDVEDLELGPYTGQGKILVYTTSKYLLEMANGLFFNTGAHTSELLLPLYHFARAGFDQFEFVTRDGMPTAVEEWNFAMAVAGNGFPAFEDKLRATAATHRDAMNSPKRTSEIPKDLSGYLGIFIPGGHAPIIETHLDSDLGALLRQAHAMDLPIMTLCHGPTALRSAALGGEFPFVGYKTKVFPDSADAQSPMVGYLPGYLKPEDQVGARLTELGMEIVGDDLDDSVYKDRELITGASNFGAQKFAELAITSLLAKYQN